MATTESLKSEMTFVPDAFRTSHQITGLFALAKRLQTLIIMEPGTIPNLTEAGVGIGTYLQEMADQTTMNSLKERISAQVEKYLPNNEINSIDTKLITSREDGKSYVALFCNLGTPLDGKTSFAMTFGTNSNGNSVKSDFYF